MRYGDISFFQSGVAVPLFSLYSRQSIGIGEFLDLIPFARWAAFCNFNIIQLLPVNDTGAESSPYSARSAFALNPVFINVQSVEGSSEYEDEIQKGKTEFQKYGKIDYYNISTWKRFVLRKIFDNRYDDLKKDKVLLRWVDDNAWAKSYCIYCTLKAQNDERSWKDWKTYRDPTAKDIEKLWKKFEKDNLFQAWMQFEAEKQFSAAVAEVSRMGVRIKGDIPILINEDSADVWADPRTAGTSLKRMTLNGGVAAWIRPASSIMPTVLTMCWDSSASGPFRRPKLRAFWVTLTRACRSLSTNSLLRALCAKRLNTCAVRITATTSCVISWAKIPIGLLLFALRSWKATRIA